MSELDVAWADAEAALPDGWRIILQGPTAPDKWRGYLAWANQRGYEPVAGMAGEGRTPVDALRALTAALAIGASA